MTFNELNYSKRYTAKCIVLVCVVASELVYKCVDFI